MTAFMNRRFDPEDRRTNCDMEFVPGLAESPERLGEEHISGDRRWANRDWRNRARRWPPGGATSCRSPAAGSRRLGLSRDGIAAVWALMTRCVETCRAWQFLVAQADDALVDRFVLYACGMNFADELDNILFELDECGGEPSAKRPFDHHRVSGTGRDDAGAFADAVESRNGRVRERAASNNSRIAAGAGAPTRLHNRNPHRAPRPPSDGTPSLNWGVKVWRHPATILKKDSPAA